MIFSVDRDRHSGRTLYTVIRVRIDVIEYSQDRQSAVAVNCLAVYRVATLGFSMRCYDRVCSHTIEMFLTRDNNFLVQQD